MINKVKAAIDNHELIQKGSTVVVALSGGSDSMALLNALHMLKADYDITLRAAHVNHCLRGNDADSDEAFVREKCRAMNIPLDVLKVDVAAEAEKSGEGLEECGRRIRYEFFDSLGEDVVIATAHNLSDRIETFLFNFARGSALRGLCSIPYRRDNIIRPLLDCSKAEILRFCEDNGIEYVTDGTNSDVKYSRNRIRHKVIPGLSNINVSFEQAAYRCISSINEDEMYLSSLADEIIIKSEKADGFDSQLLASAPLPVKKRAVVRICEKSVGVTPEQKAVVEICGLLESGGSIQINGGVTVRVRKGILYFPAESREFEKVALENVIRFGDKIIETEIININEINNLQNISKQGLEYFLDCDKIHGRVFVRSRTAGDKISLKSRHCTKSLKKLFNESSVAPEKRSAIAVFADDSGVVAVEGVGCDSRVCITAETRKVMFIRIKNGVEF